jgi:hypothetical protein
MPAAQTTPTANRMAAPVCAVRLIDRRTGRVHRVNGAPLVLFSRDTVAAAAELLLNRDRTLWDVRIDPLPAEVAQ